MMTNDRNQALYQVYPPVYDVLIGPLSRAAHQRAVARLHLQPSKQLFIPALEQGLIFRPCR